MNKVWRRRVFAIFPVLVAVVVGIMPAHAQNLSRWALGRPSLLIDMPGDPTGGGVTWAEKPIYSIFPSAWSAEGGGVRIEVARIYTNKNPADLLAEIGQKLNVPMTSGGRGQISGREFVDFVGSTRMAAVIGSDGGVLGGASWALVATYRDQNGKALAGAIFESVKVEREGARNWALRSLGPTFLAGELPFEVTPSNRETRPGIRRYETSFDGMDVTVTEQTPDAGKFLDKETSIINLATSERTAPGVTDFTFTREKYKLDQQEGELITKNFKRGHRSYRIYDIAFISKQKGVIASVQIDPARTDHQTTTERILRTLKTTVNPIYGWKTYAVGSHGLFVDLPMAPGAPRQMNAVTIYESSSPLAPVEIRELEVGFPSAHNPDFSAKQYFEMQAALSGNTKYELLGIDKLLIDGLEARLVRAIWRNGQNVNHRRILTIYGYRTQWIVDMLAAKDTQAYMERVMQSVRVKAGFGPGMIRQSFGTMGVSFLVGDKRLETKVIQDPNDADFAREESATAQLDKTILAVYEMVFKNETPPITDARAQVFMDGYLKGLSRAANIQLSAKQRDSFAINIDGIEGRHVIYDLTANVMKPGAVIQADFILLGQDKKLWTVAVITNYEGGMGAREGRARILNTLRVGM